MFHQQQNQIGDECTKFFHAMATISFRRNTITQLKDENGVLITDHEGKAGLLLMAYKSRMGISMQPRMAFDLSNLISLTVNLDSLIVSFAREEIDKIIKMLPVDKSPGPDGFNGMFMKKCWPIIKEDFYGLCQSFFYCWKASIILSSLLSLKRQILNQSMTSDQSPCLIAVSNCWQKS